jgi:predicted  nucleic acid-binding Zn-ribbon protein
MAEEKKKRWRPSLTAYRELEETIHRQCVELDAWREKCRKLVEAKSNVSDKTVSQWAYDELKKKYDELDVALTTQKHALDDAENEKKALAEKLGELCELQKDYDAVCAENLSLKSRGFWARVFNK